MKTPDQIQKDSTLGDNQVYRVNNCNSFSNRWILNSFKNDSSINFNGILNDGYVQT